MGATVRRRMKKLLLVFMWGLLLFIGGCQTIEGAYRGAAEGSKDDWKSVKDADEWMKKNLW